MKFLKFFYCYFYLINGNRARLTGAARPVVRLSNHTRALLTWVCGELVWASQTKDSPQPVESFLTAQTVKMDIRRTNPEELA